MNARRHYRTGPIDEALVRALARRELQPSDLTHCTCCICNASAVVSRTSGLNRRSVATLFCLAHYEAWVRETAPEGMQVAQFRYEDGHFLIAFTPEAT